MRSHELEFLIHGYTKFDLVDEGKGWLNPSRDKNQGKHRRKKVKRSCVTSLLCDPGSCVHKSDVQNKWDGNTHTHTLYTYINRHAGTPNKTKTNGTMSLDYISICYIGSRIGWVSMKEIYYYTGSRMGNCPNDRSYGTCLQVAIMM